MAVAVVACLVLTLQTWFVLADGQLQDLLVATARGRASLQEFLGSTDWTKRSASLLSAKDEFGFSSLAVAAYNGDWQAAELLLKHGASVTSGDITVFMGEQAVKVGSIVEFIVRRSSMLIMLGTGFKMPKYLDSVQKYISTARTPSASAPEVPDMARALELLVHAGALPTEKSQEEGSDLGRAAYFLDTTLVGVLVNKVLKPNRRAASRAVIAALLGISQLKHRLNRALLQQPRMAGRLFRDYYGFDIVSEAALLDPNFYSLSFEDTVRMVMGKARQVVRHLLGAKADPSFAQSKQSGKTALHHCAEHGLTELAQELLSARADPNRKSKPMQRTPLHQAVIHRSLGVVEALLSAGADSELVDVAGRTAPELAHLLQWTEVRQLDAFACPEGQCFWHGNPLAKEDNFALAELLPAGWHGHWQAGSMGGDWARESLTCEIDTIDEKDLTFDGFLNDFLSLRRPLRVRAGGKYMPAYERWANLRYLVRKAGETVMSAVTIPYPEDFGDVDAKDARQMSLKEYVQNVMGKVNSTSGTPLYVFSVVEQDDPKFRKLLSLIQKDVAPHPHWLQDRKDATMQRYHFGNIQFGLGPAGSGAPQHYHTHAYAALFSGKKQWLFYPPPKSSLSRQHAIKAMNEDKRRRKQLPAVEGLQEGLKLKSSFPLACEQVPGDIFYVPTDWGHMTFNAETSVSISREFSWDAEETDSRVINSLQI
ncbi:unnamed protein product [Durusdinium trenchii]|uniref:JmjC domain-containing protein 8 (Jumonji domain-containing protein 8) n=2 Tax=Durusdinium trenchii TaxID=1381693 RepID=A0ABP0LZD8_9DINO